MVDVNNVKLCDTKYQTTQLVPEFVNIQSQLSGDLLPVNPPLKFYRNSTVTFDISDSSLSYIQGVTPFPGFVFKLYKDSDFSQEYTINENSDQFAVTTTGEAGKSGAKVTFIVDSNSPKIYITD